MQHTSCSPRTVSQQRRQSKNHHFSLEKNEKLLTSHPNVFLIECVSALVFCLTAWRCHQLNSFTLRASRMAAPQGHVSKQTIKACAATHTLAHWLGQTHAYQQRDVLQIAGFMHGCHRSARSGWSRWWRVLWRWPRCSDTNIRSGN